MTSRLVIGVPVPRVIGDAYASYVGLVIIVAMLFGGGARQGLWSDVVVELAALPLLAWSLLRLRWRMLGAYGRWAVALLCAILALPLVQLIPLPPELWSLIPGRSMIAQTYRTADIALPWMPISLDPTGTWLSLLSMLPAAAVFIATLSLDPAAHRKLMKVVLFFAFFSVGLGFCQLVVGAPYFYAITNEDMAVGFFANGNHNATFLACALPYTAAFGIHSYKHSESNPAHGWRAAVLFFILVIGVAIVGSKAGIGLEFVALLTCFAMAARSGVIRRGRKLHVVGFAVLIALLAGQFVLSGWQVRNAQVGNIADDLRWPIAAVTLDAARSVLPVGSGVGTFVPVFQIFAPRTLEFERYINHAHDDWLELLLEGGIPAVILVAGFLIWFAAAAVRVWRRVWRDDLDANIPRAASVVVVLILLHSVVDYPMRTISVMIVLALSCTFLAFAAHNKAVSAETAER